MKDRYDFRKAKRGRAVPAEPEPDQDIVDRFFQMAEASGGASGYQTLINAALREYLDGKAPKLRTRCDRN